MEAIIRMASQGRVAVMRFEGTIYDVGTPMGYLRAIVKFGLARDSFRPEILDYLVVPEKSDFRSLHEPVFR